MKKFLLIILTICSCALAYSGDEGSKVFVVCMGAVEDGEVPLKITGIDSPLGDLVQKEQGSK